MTPSIGVTMSPKYLLFSDSNSDLNRSITESVMHPARMFLESYMHALIDISYLLYLPFAPAYLFHCLVADLHLAVIGQHYQSTIVVSMDTNVVSVALKQAKTSQFTIDVIGKTVNVILEVRNTIVRFLGIHRLLNVQIAHAVAIADTLLYNLAPSDYLLCYSIIN